METIQHSAVPKRSKRARSPIPLIIGSLAVVVCLLGAVAAWLLTAPKPAPEIAVSVDEPFNGDLVEINQPRVVRASTEYPGGVQRLELYADGALMGGREDEGSTGHMAILLR